MRQILLLFLLLFITTCKAQDSPVKSGGKGFGVAVVQIQPVFSGGNDSLQAFLKRNIRYPQQAKINRIQGRVYIGFMVDRNGKIVNPNILSSASPELDEEAMRVVKLMPDWTPGTAGGSAIDVQYILPIDFISPGIQNK
jgi:TonB family protein